jgi:PhnB protein
MSNTDVSTSVELQPYIFFYGRCEEALKFYKDVFGGNYDVRRFSDMPSGSSEMPMPPNYETKVMHATFNGPGFTFMASDGPGEKQIDPDEGNICLSVSTSDRAAGQRFFEKLSQGGKVNTPFGPVFWGGMFGDVVDKFGTEWMVSTQ